MLKLTLQDSQKEEFMNYVNDRIKKSSLNYNYITQSIITNTFNFFVKHRLTVEENARSYWYNQSKKEIECYGYSGYSTNDKDNIEEIKDNLFHEVFCKAEWMSRSIKEGYSDVCQAYFGKNYKTIIAK
jgi:hypothetical protein